MIGLLLCLLGKDNKLIEKENSLKKLLFYQYSRISHIFAGICQRKIPKTND